MSTKKKSIIEISKKIDFILSPIAREMYPKELKEFLCDCSPVAIENLVETIRELNSNFEVPHQYIWDIVCFEQCLRKIKSKSIKKDMSSRKYKEYVEGVIDCCYPTAWPYFGLMIVLNIDYHSDWQDIYNFFSLVRFEPKYREKYRLRPERRVKKPKALTNRMVTNTLTYSGFSKKRLSGNIDYLYNKDRERFRGFIHVLCGLQVLREDYNFFDKQLLEKVIADYWDSEYEKTLTEYDKRALNAGSDIDYLDALIVKVETEQHYKDLEINGERYYREIDTTDRDYEKEIQDLKEQIREIERFVEQYNVDYEDHIKYIYNGFWDRADVWPTDEQCNALWLTYHNTHSSVLLNSIAVLVHEYDKPDELNRIVAYYADKERRIMLADKWEFDKDSGDPFIIYPKLKRPITDGLVNGLKFGPIYKGATAEKLDIRWEEYGEAGLRQGLMYIIFVLQSKGAELIKPDIFSEVFKKQIENDKKGGSYFGIDSETIKDVLKGICSDKKDDVCKIAILLDKGYKGDEVYSYWHKELGLK